MSQLRGLDGLLRDLPQSVHYSVLEEGAQSHDRLRPEEASSLSGRAVPRRVESFRLGRAAARGALESLGAGRPTIPVGKNREPIWPEGIVGSISHAGGYAIAVVASQVDMAALGVDIEEKQSFDGIKEKVAFGHELTWLDGLEPDEADTAIVELFSAKEAIFKAFYPSVQRFFGFDSAFLEPGRPRDHYLARLAEGLHGDYPPARAFPVSVGWHKNLVMATVCLEAD